ncbi:type I polyketide synthase, partial [Streptomyces sp. NBRC 109706]|uniref:type I polyketide synthase n=1 Tax=Streptomyces sp. NBRC 109706 TaxID=1550035 RepID=UPI001F2FB7CF
MHEAVAVVGLACRLPGAPTPEEFWRLLRDGVDAVGEIPAHRWDFSEDDPERDLAVRRGGFLDRVDEFDPEFFGISPREAAAMDPQQRLMLELSWEALEDAGIVPQRLTGSQTGVFVGVMNNDYATLAHRAGLTAVGPYSLTGVQRGIIANRISYAVGLRGPSMTVDAGQASSLVSVHMACESLRRGESTLALAGGVHLNIAAESAVAAAALGALSPDGRCYTFDARANGYVRGEGGVVVALKTLSRAVADGDEIYCVIRGSAVNSGGAASMTAPDVDAQAEVLRTAYRNAGIRPEQAQYVELHGTGTVVGDPVEARALGAVLGRGRPADRPLRVGSAKTNIGHLEGAAGAVGLLKVVLSLRHGQLAPSLNFVSPNPAIPLDDLGLSVQTELSPWPADEGARTASVSSFGMGGTNCHVVLTGWEQPRPADPERPDESLPVPLLLSARGGVALGVLAGRLAGLLREGSGLGLGLVEVGRGLAVGRAGFDWRACVVGVDRGGVLAGLDGLAGGVAVSGVVEGVVVGSGGVVLVFPGQGSQWVGMARGLLESSGVFRDEVVACGVAFEGLVGWSLVDVLRGVEGAPGLDRDDVVQPVLFAVMVSLAALWRSVGVVPVAVVGHSQGEVAAAYVAGGLSLVDAARIVALRSRLVRGLAGSGGMVSVALPVVDVELRLVGWSGRVGVAAVNGPSATIVSGDVDALDELLAVLESDGVRA